MVVTSIGLDEAHQIYEVRGVVEALAVRGFAAVATDADLRELRAVLCELEEAERTVSAGQELLEIKKRFYDVLLDGCGNEVVRQTIGQLNNRISFLRSVSLSRPGRLSGTVREIRDIVEALERRDANAAHEATLRHVESASKNALETLREHLTETNETVMPQTHELGRNN